MTMDDSKEKTETTLLFTSEKQDYKKYAIYIPIGLLSVSALLAIIFIMTGAQGSAIARSFFTLIILALFSFALLGENSRINRRPALTSLGRMVALIITLLAGLWHVWAPTQLDGYSSNYSIDGFEFIERLGLFMSTIITMQIAAGFFSLYGYFYNKSETKGAILKTILAGLLAFSVAATLLSIAQTFSLNLGEDSLFWRLLGSLAILGVALILIASLLANLNRPRRSTLEEKKAYDYSESKVNQAPAGWYREAPNSDVERFWDGITWTNAARPYIEHNG